jgi:hypothetical protein
MVFSKTQMMGLGLAFPDVCLTPVGPIIVPIPYPNLALPNTAIPTCFKTFIQCMPVHNLSTTTPLSNGDNVGVSMGVASGTVMGPHRNIMGSFTSFVEGPPVTKFLSPSLQNSTNMVGLELVPSQFTTLILS